MDDDTILSLLISARGFGKTTYFKRFLMKSDRVYILYQSSRVRIDDDIIDIFSSLESAERAMEHWANVFGEMKKYKFGYLSDVWNLYIKVREVKE